MISTVKFYLHCALFQTIADKCFMLWLDTFSVEQPYIFIIHINFRQKKARKKCGQNNKLKEVIQGLIS
ncbi:hypothetical protein CWC18_08995 [Pseudoalteromonas aurantia]|uniref:Uncharacterized protein n=1 Tax=Pseudoalteromonas aurantia TaxID=43654 RepID=A0A5S3VBX6_9GAMM|nr:hypothetical protein CWC18_08995 [Pseudoalteromonas aurantia]TMO69573.1 hypothetical protein CWC19_05245 [Pseudoalteromonas aurantia]TMO74327.1 hypothetical protein CWC20_10320 [Pseudoalteromonas aurantia]